MNVRQFLLTAVCTSSLLAIVLIICCKKTKLHYAERFPDLMPILENASEFELISCEPDGEILGTCVVTDGDKRKTIIDALKKGIAEGGPVFMCFEPRHAIRLVYSGEVHFVNICFYCRRIQRINKYGERAETIPVSESPESVFDEILTKANIPLASKTQMPPTVYK